MADREPSNPLSLGHATGLLALALTLGCGDKAPSSTGAAGARTSDPPTFARDVAPIVHAHCSTCHHDGGPGPFSLVEYAEVGDHAAQIVDVTQSGLMPPWLPRQGYGRFADERRLSPRQKQILADWAAAGRPPGELAQAPKPPTFVDGWQLGEPDLVLEAEAAWTVPAEGRDIYRNFVIRVPPGSPRFVRAVELRPGDARVAHHAVLRVDVDGTARRLDAADPEPGFEGMVVLGPRMPGGRFVGWTPGRTPDPGSDDRSWPLSAGSDLVVQVHVRPSGKPESIRPQLGLHFAAGPPRTPALSLVLSSTEIDIPAGVPDYWLVETLTLPAPVRVRSIYPHAHYVAKRIEVWADLPNGQREWLLRIDDWDFDWQDQYRYANPVELPAGSVITMHHRYDNSADNPRNPWSPPRRVKFGPSSTDEMAELILEVEPRDPADLELLDDALEQRWLEIQLRTAEHRLFAAPEDPERLANLASLLAHVGRLDEARTSYQASLERRDDPGVRVDLAIVLHRMDEARAADAQLDAALALDPDHARAHLVRANHLREAGELKAAVTAYERAIVAEPELAEAHNNLGVTFEGLGRPKQAAEAFARAVELAPGRAQFHQNLGRAREAAGDPDGALTAYRAALERDPGSVVAMRGIAWLLATHPRPEARDPAEALRVAELACQVTEYRSPETLEALAAALAAGGKLGEASEAITRAIELAELAGRNDLAARYRRHAAALGRGEALGSG